MPELPEVETTLRGILPHTEGHRIVAVVVRQPRLRWPVPDQLATELVGHAIDAVQRRAKYLLLRIGAGHLLLHLGMSGSLRVVEAASPAQPHDHVDIVLDDGNALRLRDPRRFGAVLWCSGDIDHHPLLAQLGPEPLGDDFDGDYLYRLSQGRRTAVKPFLMAQQVVVGVGNIYANEALFVAGIDPARAAGRISRARYRRLAEAIREVLAAAIRAGGTTLRDFRHSDGKPGYFSQELRVYGREGLPCPRCATPLRGLRLGQRATTYCPRCQR